MLTPPSRARLSLLLSSNTVLTNTVVCVVKVSFACLSLLACLSGLLACSSGGPSVNQPSDSSKTTTVETPSSSTVAERGPTSPAELTLKDLDALPRLIGPSNVKRWEPSGVAILGQTLWVVSDRDAWLAEYQLPLKAGANEPISASILKPNVSNRIKFEGLEATADGALLIVEAISRTVWRCVAPKEGCPQLSAVSLDALNPALNKAVPEPYKYIMFESVSRHQETLIVGVRGFQSKKNGLTPWSLLASPAPALIHHAPRGLVVEGRRYGLSGASADDRRGGLWLTWSYEDEDGKTTSAVAGLLTFAPWQVAKKEEMSAPKGGILELGAHRIGPLQFCQTFPLKPEGVTTHDQEVIVVFDEDLDRKGGRSDQFNLRGNEDYAWVGRGVTCRASKE